MKLLSEIRFLTISTLIFMFVSLVSVSYLCFYSNTPHHLGNAGLPSDSIVVEVPLSATATKGQILFKQHCAKCHYVTDQKSVGPGLKNVMDRIDEMQFVTWVQNPTESIKKDKYFEKLAEKFYPERMPSFKLSKEEILLIKDYIEM